jgi:ferredoxin
MPRSLSADVLFSGSDNKNSSCIQCGICIEVCLPRGLRQEAALLPLSSYYDTVPTLPVGGVLL